MTLDTSECSVLSMLSDSPIRCVTGLCGLSLNCHRDRKVSRELIVRNIKCAGCGNIIVCKHSHFLLLFVSIYLSLQTTGYSSYVAMKMKASLVSFQS